MKLYTLLLAFLMLARTLCGQTDSASIASKPDLSKMVTYKDVYLQKSRAEKVTAFVMLGIGTATALTGMMMMQTAKSTGPNTPLPPTEAFDGAGLVLLGMLIDLGSIPFFISSSKNKEKAMLLSLKTEPIPNEMIACVKQHSIPSLSLKCKLR